MRKLLSVVSATLLCTALYADSTDTSDTSEVVIPVVSAAQAKANLTPPPTSAGANLPSAATKSTASTLPPLERSQVAMEPGVNEIIQVAVNHLNRIVTPFARPMVTTSSPATTEIRDHVIYIGTTHKTPLTLFITEAGSEERALSLTLIPREIPPREIFLQLKDGSSNRRLSQEAEQWEKAQPYLLTLETLFRSLALGELPPGYGLADTPEGRLPDCRQTGLVFDFKAGQTIVGHNLVVHIGVAANTSPYAIEFIESTCGDWDIAAVAAYPLTVLNPGDRTEVYVASKRYFQREIRATRPSLLVGGN